MVGIGSIWLRIETGGGLMWTRWWTSGFHKMLGSSRAAAQLAASQEGLSSMSEWVSELIDGCQPHLVLRSAFNSDSYQSSITACRWVLTEMVTELQSIRNLIDIFFIFATRFYQRSLPHDSILRHFIFSHLISVFYLILSRVSVTKARVWIGESVYWIFTSRNYN
jgi:hypothetical protein